MPGTWALPDFTDPVSGPRPKIPDPRDGRDGCIRTAPCDGPGRPPQLRQGLMPCLRHQRRSNWSRTLPEDRLSSTQLLAMPQPGYRQLTLCRPKNVGLALRRRQLFPAGESDPRGECRTLASPCMSPAQECQFLGLQLNGQIRNGPMLAAKWHCPYSLVRTSIVVPSALAMRAMAETDPDLSPRSISER